jgi:anti-sigma factor RsiW
VNCELAQTTVHGYFDGELDAVRSADFERHLESCAECQHNLKEIESLRTQLQDSDLFEPASARLRERILEQIAQEPNETRSKSSPSRKLFLIPAFTTLAAAAASVVIVMFFFQSHAQSTRITAELIDAHVRSLQPGHLTDVLSTDQHTVKPWFDGKLDFVPPVADFSAQGFPLVGGRLDIIDGHEVAVIVYSRRKHVINLFVWPSQDGGRRLAGSGSRNGYNWLGWGSENQQFCLVTDASSTDLRELQKLLQE